MTLVDAVLSQLGRSDLPVQDILPHLTSKLRSSSDLCALIAPPGSGKTLLAPVWLWETGFYHRVFVFQPRRVTARLPALLLRKACGATVGYRIRFEQMWDEIKTKIGFLTYGTALRTFADTPANIRDLWIFDEFHERPWEADLLLTYARALQSRNAGPSVLLMSATLDKNALPSQTPVLESDGRLYPVDISWEKREPPAAGNALELAKMIAQRSLELKRESDGEQLIFLPSMAAIRAAERALISDSLPGPVDVLHSAIDESDLRRVVERRADAGFRRVLSTNMGESSITLPGITTVIDAGLQRRPYNNALGLGVDLHDVRAPRASLAQRAGRAGRLGPGRCHRLFTQSDELHRPDFAPPEVQSVDPRTLALHLASLGLLKSWDSLQWMTPPRGRPLQEAERWLKRHSLLDDNLRLNSRGAKVLEAACSPRVGLFGLLAWESNWSAIQIADWTYALETGPDRSEKPLARTVTELLEDREWMKRRDQRLLASLRQTFETRATQDPKNKLPSITPSQMLLRAYGDTLVLLSENRAVSRNVEQEAFLFQSQYPVDRQFAVLLRTSPSGGSGPKSRVGLYEIVSSEQVWEELFTDLEESQDLLWISKSKTVKETRRTFIGSLLLEEHTHPVEPGPEVGAILEMHLGSEDFGPEIQVLARRLELYFQVYPEHFDHLRMDRPTAQEGPSQATWADFMAWLQRTYLDTITTWRSSCPAALKTHILQTLGYTLVKKLDDALPTSLNLPRRRRPVEVTYVADGPPYVASRLQDFFGWKPPLLLHGRLSLVYHLLAPNGRPAQITDDLQGFWRGSYQQVRKDLRGRYPKHDWPVDPTVDGQGDAR